MVTAGEFVETLMLLGNGVVLALVARVLHFSPVVSTRAVPVSFFGGEFFGSIIPVVDTYTAEMFPARVRSTAAGTVYSVSRLSTSLFVYIITTWLLPHGLLAVYSLIWVFILIVVVGIAVFGPKASRRAVETIAS